MAEVQVFTDQSGANTGTALSAANLGTAATASSCLLSGGIPSTNGTLVLTQPAAVAVVNAGPGAVALVQPTSTGLTFTASKDTYVDLSNTGSYTLAAVANNAAAPGLTANSMRLYKAVSNGSQVTSITQIASPFGMDQASTQTDLTEASTLDTLSATSSLLNNLNRLRYAFTNLFGLTWSQILAATKKPVLSDGSNSANATWAGNLQVVGQIGSGGGGTPTFTASSPFSSGSAVGNDTAGVITATLASGTYTAGVVTNLGSLVFHDTHGSAPRISSVTAASGPATGIGAPIADGLGSANISMHWMPYVTTTSGAPVVLTFYYLNIW